MRLLNTSLYWRLLLWFCAANLLVLVLGGLLVRGFIEYSTSVDINWATLAQTADQAYESGGQKALAAWVEQERQQGIEATLFEHGQPLVAIHLHPHLRARLPEWLATGRNTVMEPRPGFHVAIQQVTGKDGQPRQLLAMTAFHPRLHPQVLLLSQLALSLLFIGLVSWWVARSVAQPVEALRQAARKMAGGELSARVAWKGGASHDELVQLADDFDMMAGRIEALVAHDRGVLRDLSHELRSPLARLHLILDLARRGNTPTEAAAYFEQAEQEIARLDRMLGDMLALSRMEAGLPGMERERLELADVVQGCLEQSRLEADARHVGLRLTGSHSAVVSGSATLVERAFDNLLTNAIKFSPEGGVVEMTLRHDERFATVTIRDHGPGVPEAELEQLFRPFFRGSNAARADGHGLGLAIVQRVVQVHGGQIEARNAQGGGLEIEVRWPLA